VNCLPPLRLSLHGSVMWVALGCGLTACDLGGPSAPSHGPGGPEAGAHEGPPRVSHEVALAATELFLFLENGNTKHLDSATELLARPAGADAQRTAMRRELLSDLVAYFGLPEAERAKFGSDALYRSVLHYLVSQDQESLEHFLVEKYIDPDGDNPGYSPGTFAKVMLYCSVPSRVAFDRPDRVVEFSGASAGDRVADIGAGPGFYSLRFAQAVGETGEVYAIDIDSEIIGFLRWLVKEEGIGNLVPHMSSVKDVALPEASVDLAFMARLIGDVESYQKGSRSAFYTSVSEVVRPGGALVVCDNERDSVAPIEAAFIARLFGDYGFELQDEHRFESDPGQYCLRLRRIGAEPEPR
jgi:SAM-dependent methyltransferase